MQSINLKKMRVNPLLIRGYLAHIQMRNFLRMRMTIVMTFGIHTTGLWLEHSLKLLTIMEIC